MDSTMEEDNNVEQEELKQDGMPPRLSLPPPPPLQRMVPLPSTLSVSVTRLEDYMHAPSRSSNGNSSNFTALPNLTSRMGPEAGPSNFTPFKLRKYKKSKADYSRTNWNSALCRDGVRSVKRNTESTVLSSMLEVAAQYTHSNLKRRLPLPPSSKSEKSKHKQVAFPRKSPSKPSASTATSLKTLKKYRAARNAQGIAEAKPPRLSPMKPRIMPNRKPKTEIKRKKLFVEDEDDEEGGEEEDEDDEQSSDDKKDETQETEKKDVDEEEEIRRWLACHEEYDLRPVRAAAVAAAKKGQLGVIKSRVAKKPTLFRVPINKIPKGRSRHAIMKRAHKPKPIRKSPNDDEIEFHNSILFRGKYFQTGDIVSFHQSDGTGPFYLQIRYIVTDEYYMECASLRWLVPKFPEATILPFQPKNYELCKTEDDVTKSLGDVEFVVHCPLEYFTLEKRQEFLQPVNGTIYIRFNQSDSLMTTEKVDFPELAKYREQNKEAIEKQKREREEEEALNRITISDSDEGSQGCEVSKSSKKGQEQGQSHQSEGNAEYSELLEELGLKDAEVVVINNKMDDMINAVKGARITEYKENNHPKACGSNDTVIII